MTHAHDDPEIDLPAYLAGRLDEAARARVEAHLRDCDECDATANAWLGILPALRERGRELVDPHPSEARLGEYAQGGAGAADAATGRHVASCATCELQVEALKRWPGEPHGLEGDPGRAVGARKPRARAAWSAGIAAAAAGALIGFLAGLNAPQRGAPTAGDGTGRDAAHSSGAPAVKTGAQPPGTDAPPRGGEWDGPVRLLLLTPPTRGNASGSVFAHRPGEPVVVGVVPPLPAAIPGETRYRFSLQDPAAGREVWGTEMTASEMRAQMKAADVVTFVLPASRLAPGRFALRLQRADVTGEGPILDLRFSLE